MAVDATLKEDAPLGQSAGLERVQTPRAEATTAGELTAAQVTRAVLLLSVMVFCFQVTMNVTESIKPNFFRDVLGMDGALNGYLVAIREIPGFLLIFVAAGYGTDFGEQDLNQSPNFWDVTNTGTTPTGWHRYELDVDLVGRTVAFRRDGVEVAKRSLVLTYGKFGGVLVGVGYTSGNGMTRTIRFDDVGIRFD